MNLSAPVIYQILSAVGGLSGIALMVKAFVERSKIRADATKTLTSTVVSIVGPLEDRLRRVNAENARLRDVIDMARVYVARLEAVCHNNKLKTPPRPKMLDLYGDEVDPLFDTDVEV